MPAFCTRRVQVLRLPTIAVPFVGV